MKQTRTSVTLERILLVAVIALMIWVVVFSNTYAEPIATPVFPASLPSEPVRAPAGVINGNITHTTVADFNPGSFYLTGMTEKTNAGGDGNGEVRLLTVGISAQDWVSVTTGFPPALFGHAAARWNNIIFVSGGRKDPNQIFQVENKIYSATIQSNHSLSAWQQLGNLIPSGGAAYHGMVVIGNTLVIIGGYNSGGMLTSVYTATIGTNGTIGPLQAAAPLPEARSDFGITVVNGKIYVIGGNAGSPAATHTTFYATPDSTSGAITQWFTATLQTPTQVDNTLGDYTEHAAAAYNDKLYFMGGTDYGTDGTQTYFGYSFYAQPDPSTGNIVSPNFTKTLNIGNNVVMASSAAFGGQVHLIGGATDNASAGTRLIYSALISTTGELFNPIAPSGWQQSNILSTGRIRSASVMSVDGWLYVLGGVSGAMGSQTSLGSYDYGPTSGDYATDYAPNGTYTSPIIDVGGSFTVTNIAWNTTVLPSNGMSLTLKYYCGNSPVSLTICNAPASGAVVGTKQTTNTPVNIVARYWKYVVNFERGSVSSQTPVLNEVRVDYTIPDYPDFKITSLTAPITSSVPTTQIITYTVSNLALTRSPSRSAATSTRRVPLVSPPMPGATIWVTFYANRLTRPADPNVVSPASGAMTCTDAAHGAPGQSYPPFILFPYELYSNPPESTFYASCLVPGYATNFYAQVDTCDATAGDSNCYQYGYVFELDEINGFPKPGNDNNVIGPFPARPIGGSSSSSSSSSSGGLFLPFVRR